MGLIITFSFFASLFAASLASRTVASRLTSRRGSEWAIDGLGLFIQGALIPILQIGVLNLALRTWAPQYQGTLEMPALLSFVLNFVVIDYFYYWNHRFLHTHSMWRWHRLHHSSQWLDLISTSRNSLVTSFFIVYFWLNGLFIFLLESPEPFIAAAALGAGMDLWRHSGFSPDPSSRLHRALSGWLILPACHEWHHSRDLSGVNFGANLSIWDRLHGTWHSPPARAEALGLDESSVSLNELLWPSPLTESEK